MASKSDLLTARGRPTPLRKMIRVYPSIRQIKVDFFGSALQSQLSPRPSKVKGGLTLINLRMINILARD